MKSQPLVSILILNWNRGLDTLDAIASAIDQTYDNIEIIVIDNGSVDNSIELIKNNFPYIKLITLEKNYGCPGGRNRGIEYCSGDYIFFLDNDGVLHKEAVKIAVNTITKEKSIKVVTGWVKHFESKSEIDSAFSLPKDSIYSVVRSFQGGISLHDKSLYEEVGLYPDNFMYGSEEGHLSLRILSSGYKIVQNKSVILWHKKEDASKSEKEIIQTLINRFITVYELFPLDYLIMYLIKYVFYYTIIVTKKHILFSFLKVNLIQLPKRIKRSKRQPLNRRIVKLYRNLSPLEREK